MKPNSARAEGLLPGEAPAHTAHARAGARARPAGGPRLSPAMGAEMRFLVIYIDATCSFVRPRVQLRAATTRTSGCGPCVKARQALVALLRVGRMALAPCIRVGSYTNAHSFAGRMVGVGWCAAAANACPSDASIWQVAPTGLLRQRTPTGQVDSNSCGAVSMTRSLAL